jgi:hypothetical protein
MLVIARCRGIIMSNYIREGERSFDLNKGKYINPYSIGNARYNDFERGWIQALRRSSWQPREKRRAVAQASRRRSKVSPDHSPTTNTKEMPEDIYLMLEGRAREKLLNDPSYEPPRCGWQSSVYYIRVEASPMPLWKIGVTCNNLRSRYCIADRRFIMQIKSWKYGTRQVAEAIEREILTEFADALYKGSPVLRSGGDGELFMRDVLQLDAQDDFRAIARRERQADSGNPSKLGDQPHE